MSSMENQGWDATLTNSIDPRPSVSKVLFDLKKKELESPIFVCLQCRKESPSQQAMAAHCRQHVRAGMEKGTVEHIKYYPNDTFVFLGNNPKPIPQGPRSTDQQVMIDAPKIMTQVPTGRYNRFLPYTGCFSMSDLAKYPWLQLNGPNQDLINVRNMHPNCATLQQPMHTTFVGLSSMFPSGALLSPKPNGVGPSTTPSSVPPDIDLTLRLGPAPRSAAEVSVQGTSFPFRFSDYF